MTKQVINVGTTANDKKGDSLRAAFQKVNTNFTELYTALGLDNGAGLNLGNFQFTNNTIKLINPATDGSTLNTVIIDQPVEVGSDLSVGGDILPKVNLGGSLGSPTQQWKSLYVSTNTIYINNVPLSLDGSNNIIVNGSPISSTIEYASIPDAPTDIADLTDNTNLLSGGTGDYTFESSNLFATGRVEITNGSTYNEDWNAGIQIPARGAEDTLYIRNISVEGNDICLQTPHGTWTLTSNGDFIIPNGGNINYAQDGARLLAPATGGETDKIRLWDFYDADTVNYAIGAEPNHMWFSIDAGTNSTGFKFYGGVDQIFNIRGDGALEFADTSVQTTAWTGDQEVSTTSDVKFDSVQSNIIAPITTGSNRYTITGVGPESPWTNPYVTVSGSLASGGFVEGEQIEITGVTTPSQVNGLWYVSFRSSNSFRIYSDSGLTTTPNASGWAAYTGSGVVKNVDTPAGLNITNNSNVWTFGTDATLSLPECGAVGAAVIQPNDTTFGIKLISNGHTFAFGTDGSLSFPTQTVNLHNGGNQSAQTLQFGDASQQAVITGPTPGTDQDAQRIIIQGQRGNGVGEGGDVYLWGGDAETNGGDIKIYAGDADSVSSGSGGYVNIDAGNGYDNGGDVTLTAGNATGYGGDVTLTAGSGGTGNGTVYIQTYGHNWEFDPAGRVVLPPSGTVVDNTGVNQLANRVEGSWTVTAGTNTYSFTVPGDGTYTLWVKGNIPNGIITWNATLSISNTNVPAIGQQFAWNYTGGGSPILLTSLPDQIRGSAGTISTDATYAGTTSNRFDFGISNSSGSNQTIYYGYIKI